MKIKFFSVFLLLLAFLVNCENQNNGQNRINSEVEKMKLTKIDFNRIKNKTIYFGHQSVGYNIIEGINDILKKEQNDSIKLLEIKNVNEINLRAFSHSKNGENFNPKSKVDSFIKFINNAARKKLDIAFFKFCYVDISRDSDVDNIFNYYQRNMKELNKKFPGIKFMHVTVPLTTYKTPGLKDNIKDFIKSIIGKETNETRMKKDNIKRNNFNELIRSSYSKNEVFDLAGIESLNTKGKKEQFMFDGKRYESLVPEYTYDGGHLNELGRIIVANAFLKYLTKLD